MYLLGAPECHFIYVCLHFWLLWGRCVCACVVVGEYKPHLQILGEEDIRGSVSSVNTHILNPGTFLNVTKQAIHGQIAKSQFTFTV